MKKLKKALSIICAVSFILTLLAVAPAMAAGAAAVSGTTTLEFETLLAGDQISYTNIEPGKAEKSANANSVATQPEGEEYIVFQAKTRHDGIKFTVNVTEEGYYDITVRETRHKAYANQKGWLYVDGEYITFDSTDSAINTGNTTGTLVSLDYGSAYLTAGTHTISVIEYASYLNDYYYDWIKFTKNQVVKYLDAEPSAYGTATITSTTTGLLPYYQCDAEAVNGMEFNVSVPELGKYKVDVLAMYSTNAAKVNAYIDGVAYGQGIQMFQSDNRYYNISEDAYVRLDRGLHTIRLVVSPEGSGTKMRVSAVRFTKSVSDSNILVARPAFTVNQAALSDKTEVFEFENLTVTDDGTSIKETESSPGYYEIDAVNSSGKTAEFSFNVAESGKYNVKITSYVYRSTTGSLYQTKLTDISMDGNALPSSYAHAYEDADQNNWKTIDLGQVWLDEGAHTFSIKFCGTNAVHRLDKMTINKSNDVSFFAANELDNITKSNEDATIENRTNDLYGNVMFTPTALNEYITFNMPVAMAGAYDVEIVVKCGTNRGKYNIYVNDNQIGSKQDFTTAYSYRTINIGSATLAKGNAVIKFESAEAGSNGGMGMILSRVNLKPTEITEAAPSVLPASGELYGYTDFVNNTNSSDHAVLVAAYYQSVNGIDQLIDVKTYQKTLASGESEIVYCALHTSSKYSETDKIKLFVWDDLTNVMPLAEYAQLGK